MLSRGGVGREWVWRDIPVYAVGRKYTNWIGLGHLYCNSGVGICPIPSTMVELTYSDQVMLR